MAGACAAPRAPCIAFCFLAREDVLFPSLWAAWFATAPRELYTVRVHQSHGATPPVTHMPNALCIPQIPTAHATFSLLRVQQALAESALFSSACRCTPPTTCAECSGPGSNVVKVCFLSGDSIPVVSFAEVYAMLTREPEKGMLVPEPPNANHRRREALCVARRDAAGWPAAWPWTWRVASQWCVLTRRHVELLHAHWPVLERIFDGSSVPDEHMYVVFFAGLGMLESSFQRAAHVYVEWDRGEVEYECVEAHREEPPYTWHAHELTPDLLLRVRDDGFLFMRKICPTAVFPRPPFHE